MLWYFLFHLIWYNIIHIRIFHGNYESWKQIWFITSLQSIKIIKIWYLKRKKNSGAGSRTPLPWMRTMYPNRWTTPDVKIQIQMTWNYFFKLSSSKTPKIKSQLVQAWWILFLEVLKKIEYRHKHLINFWMIFDK